MAVTPLAAGVDYFDLHFLGEGGIIATGLLSGRDGVALIDPGPTTTLPVLLKALDDRGIQPVDVRTILLTHIHLDHAGAVGSLVRSCPHAAVVVHAVGAPHLVDPSTLLKSAARLYGADMDRLWGEVLPVQRERVQVAGNERLRVAGHDIFVAETPGHASHHLSFFLPESRLAFVGDTAGICRASGRAVLPPTPPPDIDLEAWRRSTQRILDWNPETLFLTHFGPQPSPRLHMADLWTRMDDWSRRVRASLERPDTDAERAERFTVEIMDDLARTTSRAEAEAYAAAGRFDFSWLGLARYWRKRLTS